MRQINKAWLDGRVDDLRPKVHPDIVMVFPGFGGRSQGREAFLAGFEDFCRNAKTLEFHDRDLDVDVAGDTAVVTFRYEMVYERSGERYRSTGRDLWVLQAANNDWLAVWRTMLDIEEVAAEEDHTRA
ncbi:MAG TPA: nuclear transport factor 2 family protein [Bryobacteraceae bacterium]|nr:nuclear transport factor 2 family protein [Bryobacteraceae bacterium]